MKVLAHRSALVLGAALAAGGLQAQDEAAWQDLSGSFQAWEQTGAQAWRIENGEFVADDGAASMLVSKQAYEDLQLSLEFWTDAGANSGVFLRASQPEAIADSNAYEVNIFDTRPDQTYRTGGVVHFAAPAEVIDTAGQWNSYEITLQGQRLRVLLNGVVVVDMEDDTYASGPVALQYGSGEVRFRNVRIRAL